MDRRIGEGDTTLTPEERMAHRFARQTQTRHSLSVFNLEEEEEDGLTHYGRPLDTDNLDNHGNSTSEPGSDSDYFRPSKRKMSAINSTSNPYQLENSGRPLVKKTKAEVMQEVIEKSKFHKYERQKEREGDEDLRETLDKDMSILLSALRPELELSWNARRQAYRMYSNRPALPSRVDKEYDEQLRLMALDKRAQPSDRTQTGEEVLRKYSTRRMEQQKKRLLRMAGTDDDSSEEDKSTSILDPNAKRSLLNEAKELGVSDFETPHKQIEAEEEDRFMIDSELVASGSEIDESASSSDFDSNDDDINDQCGSGFGKPLKLLADTFAVPKDPPQSHTYSYLQSQEEFIEFLQCFPNSDVMNLIQRVRVAFHPQLSKENNQKLSHVAVVLVDVLANQSHRKLLPVESIDSIIRHIHSLSRNYAEAISKRILGVLRVMSVKPSLSICDLVVLRAIGAIYPTSDHFHQVVTPAVTVMAKWLDTMRTFATQDLLFGATIVDIFVEYQAFSKRYVPELLNYIVKVLLLDGLAERIRNLFEKLLLAVVELWVAAPSFVEIATYTEYPIPESIQDFTVRQKIAILLDRSRLTRRFLELHHHRPLPVKTQTPKFEESFAPTKIYEIDRTKLEAKNLRAEYKRERKGALRELRKDSNFIAREKLAEKKRQDRAYQIKYNKIIVGIQSEEGREKNLYTQAKAARKIKG